MRQQPSAVFLAAVRRAYDEAKAEREPVTPSAIWDWVCMRAAPVQGQFTFLFEWDNRRSRVNRIATIIEVIEAGLVPGLEMGQDNRGRAIVVEA